jgi:hypothetical protein
MPPPQSFDQALAAFYAKQMESPSIRSMRIEEALCAALEGQNGFDEQGRLIIDTDRMARAAAAGHKIKAETDGARMTFSVVDADGNPVPIQTRQRFARTSGPSVPLDQ